LYCVPVCPWNFQLAPETWPHSFPNAGGSPGLVDDAVLASRAAAKSMGSRRQIRRVNQRVLVIVEFLSGWVARVEATQVNQSRLSSTLSPPQSVAAGSSRGAERGGRAEEP
jgi:hypothetical protein